MSPPVIDIAEESQDVGTQDEGLDEVGVMDTVFITSTSTESTPTRVHRKKNKKRRRDADENSPCTYISGALTQCISPSFVESPRRCATNGGQLQDYNWVYAPSRVEKLWNKDTATTFDSQVKHEEYEAKRQHLNRCDLHLSTTFLVGMDMIVLLGLLKKDTDDLDKRVTITISSGKNELQFCASHFLDEVVANINDFLLCSSTDSIYMQLTDDVKVVIYKDAISTWIVLRFYVDGYVMEKLYISAQTWIDIQRITPVLRQCRDNYINNILQGKFAAPIEEEK
jgi:hypothetical protein